MKIPCLPLEQGKGKFWLCKVQLKEILGRCRVDQQSPENPHGYQREGFPSRARKFGKFIQKGHYSPVNLLINIRDTKVTENNGNLVIPDHADWWLVDGQHRFLGLKIVTEEAPHLREIEIPVILLNCDKIQEAKQFLIINKMQKGVRTDLVERIIANLEKEQGREALLDEDLPIDHKSPEALRVVDILTDTESSPLYKKIKRPGEKGMQPLKQISVTDSIKPIIDVYPGYLKSETMVAKALMNVWGALKDICPECFEKPKDYLLLKTPGVFVMHRIFANLLPVLCSTKDRDLTRNMFVKLFSHSEVSDYFTSNFWDRENIDGVGRYGTSQKSYSIIFDLIWSDLRKVIDDIVPDQAEVKI